MTATIKLFLSGLVGAVITYTVAHLSDITTNTMIISIVGGLLTSVGHSLPSPVAGQTSDVIIPKSK